MCTTPLAIRFPAPVIEALDRVRTEQTRNRSNLVLRYVMEGLERDGARVAAPAEARRGS